MKRLRRPDAREGRVFSGPQSSLAAGANAVIGSSTRSAPASGRGVNSCGAGGGGGGGGGAKAAGVGRAIGLTAGISAVTSSPGRSPPKTGAAWTGDACAATGSSATGISAVRSWSCDSAAAKASLTFARSSARSEVGRSGARCPRRQTSSVGPSGAAHSAHDRVLKVSTSPISIRYELVRG